LNRRRVLLDQEIPITLSDGSLLSQVKIQCVANPAPSSAMQTLEGTFQMRAMNRMEERALLGGRDAAAFFSVEHRVAENGFIEGIDFDFVLEGSDHSSVACYSMQILRSPQRLGMAERQRVLAQVSGHSTLQAFRANLAGVKAMLSEAGLVVDEFSVCSER
jgi:hypothetical protein